MNFGQPGGAACRETTSGDEQRTIVSSISSEIARKGSEEKAWKRRKRKTMIRDLLSNSRDDKGDREEKGVAKWREEFSIMTS